MRTGLAQLVERTALNRVVKGSIPLAGGSSFFIFVFTPPPNILSSSALAITPGRALPLV